MSDVGVAERERVDATGEEEGDDRRLVITLTGDAAAATRRLAALLGITPPEVMRRGLTLLDVLASLEPAEELVIRNRNTSQVDRLRFHWGY